MIVFESRKQRRVLVRLERGEDVLRSLEKLAQAEQIGAGWVRGVGAFEWAQLERPGRAQSEPVRIDEPCDAPSIEGHIALEGRFASVTLHATVATRSEGVVGGRLVGAAATSVELAIDVFEDVRLQQVEDDEVGRSVWSGRSRPGVAAAPTEAPARPERGAGSPLEAAGRAWVRAVDEDPRDHDPDEEDPDENVGPAPAAPAASGSVSWADVAAVSAAPEVAPPTRSASRGAPPRAPSREPASPAFAPPPIPGRSREPERASGFHPTKGDFVQHRQFGTCKIDRDDGAGGITLRLPSGVRKKIKLQYMEVGAPRDEGGRTVYPIRPRKR